MMQKRVGNAGGKTQRGEVKGIQGNLMRKCDIGQLRKGRFGLNGGEKGMRALVRAGNRPEKR